MRSFVVLAVLLCLTSFAYAQFDFSSGYVEAIENDRRGHNIIYWGVVEPVAQYWGVYWTSLRPGSTDEPEPLEPFSDSLYRTSLGAEWYANTIIEYSDSSAASSVLPAVAMLAAPLLCFFML